MCAISASGSLRAVRPSCLSWLAFAAIRASAASAWLDAATLKSAGGASARLS